MATSVAELGLLHVRVARRREAGCFERQLYEARAVDAETRAAAPQVRRADEALGELDEIGRAAAALGDMARDDETASLEHEKALVTAGDAQLGIHAEMHQRRGFDVGYRIDERAERAHAVRRLVDVRRQRLGRHVADVAVTVELHPGPALALVVDGNRFAEQRLRLEAERRRGRLRSGTEARTTCAA